MMKLLSTSSTHDSFKKNYLKKWNEINNFINDSPCRSSRRRSWYRSVWLKRGNVCGSVRKLAVELHKCGPLFIPTGLYFACKRNDTALAGVIDTSLFNRSSIDPLVNYRQSPGTNHHCGDTVTGHQSIHAVGGSFLSIVSMYFTALSSFLSFVYLFAQLFHLLFCIFFLSFHIWISCASHLLLSYISLSSMIEISL